MYCLLTELSRNADIPEKQILETNFEDYVPSKILIIIVGLFILFVIYQLVMLYFKEKQTKKLQDTLISAEQKQLTKDKKRRSVTEFERKQVIDEILTRKKP